MRSFLDSPLPDIGNGERGAEEDAMRTTGIRSARWLGLFPLTLAAACSSGGNRQGAEKVVQVANADAGGDAGPATFVRKYDLVTVTTTRTQDESGVAIRSSVVNAAGDEVFQTEMVGLGIDPPNDTDAGPVPPPDQLTLDWTWLTTDQSGSVPIGEQGKVGEPTLERANAATMLLYGQIPESGDVAPLNTAGCDGNHFMDCIPGGVGRCCDHHDQCYYDHKCTSKSWRGTEGVRCSLCNAAVAVCYMSFGGIAAPGPSACCALGNCKKDTCAMKDSVPITLPSCAGVCSDPKTDPKNCGGCGKACPGGQICEGGACTPPTTPGGSWGDPHLVTFDGLKYDFQAVGELVVVTNGGSLVVQARQRPWGSSRTVAINAAIAARVVTDRVAVYANQTPHLRVNGKPTALSGDLVLPGGGKVTAAGEAYTIRWPGGDRLELTVAGDHVDSNIRLTDAQKGKVSGILGNFDGDWKNDMASRGGVVMPQPVSFADLYKVFAPYWRVSAAESLFDYAAGESTTSMTDTTFPGEAVSVQSLTPAQRTAATAVCTGAGVTDAHLLDACVHDVGLTGEKGYATGAAAAPPPTSVVQTLVGYGGSASKYRVIASSADAPVGWQTPEFDDGAWAASKGAIGDGGLYCGALPVASPWSCSSDALVRVPFVMADVCSVASVKVGFAIDNDIIEAYVNGTKILAAPFVHEGCASRDSLVLTIPASALKGGANVLAVRARDRGAPCYYDQQISLVANAACK